MSRHQTLDTHRSNLDAGSNSRIHWIPTFCPTLSKVRSIAASSMLMAGSVTSINFFGATAAIAQTAAFTCNNIYVSVQSGAPSNNFPVGKQFHQLNWGDGTLGTQIGGNATGVTGGIGIDPLTKLIYYIDGAGGGGHNTDNNSATPNVGKIWSFNGTHTDTTYTIADPTAEHQAGMDLQGILWSTKWNADKNLYQYNKMANATSLGAITAATSSPQAEWTNLAEGDFVFDKNNKMWFVSTYVPTSGTRQIAIWTIDRSTRVATKVGNYTPSVPLSATHVVTGGAFGPDGKMYIATSLGHIYKFDIFSNTLTALKTTNGSTITDMTSCMYPAINITGKVWNDTDFSAHGTFTINTASKSGTNGGGLNAILIDSNSIVIATAAVNASGSYSFATLSGNQTGLKIRLSTTAGTVGQTAPAASIPAGWENTTPTETTAFDSLSNTDISGKDFGLVAITSAGSPFTCNGRFYQMKSVLDASIPDTYYSQLYLIDRRTQPYGQNPVFAAPNFRRALNGMGYNKADNYLYAIYLAPSLTAAGGGSTGTNSTQGLYKIGQSGLESLGAITGLPNAFQPTAADFDNSGNLYVTRSAGGTDLYKINVQTKTATQIGLNQTTPNLGDMSYNPSDNFLYGVAGTKLYKISTTGTTTFIEMSSTNPGWPAASDDKLPGWGTTFFDPAGNFYAYDNGGVFYFINLTTGVATKISDGQAASKSDGASCVYPPPKLNVTKSVGSVTRIDAKTFDIPYTIVLSSAGPTNATNVQINENLKSVFSTAQSVTVKATPGITVTGGALTLNSSFNGNTNVTLLGGNDTLVTPQSRTITFTVRVVYATPATVPTTLVTNNIYASTISTPNNPGYTTGVNDVQIPPPDLLDLKSATVSTTLPSANLLLVKRITAINGLTTNDGIDLSKSFPTVDNPATDNDNNPNWPTGSLKGAYNAGKVKPGDIIEYTIYFMNANGTKAKNVRICDRIVGKQTFVSNAYGVTGENKDIEYQLSTNPVRYLTKAGDTDRGQVDASTGTIARCSAPDASITGANNGTVIVDVTKSGAPNTTDDIDEIPSATAPGTANSYGYIRFKTKVTP